MSVRIPLSGGPVWLAAAMAGLGVSLCQAQPANDMFANRAFLSGTNLIINADNWGATRESGEPWPADVWSGCSVWWSWTAPASGTVTISTEGSSFDTVLGVYTGSFLSYLTAVASNDDADGAGVGTTSKLTCQVDAGRTYQIVVAGYGQDNPASGSIVLHLQAGPFQPAAAWSLPDPTGFMRSSTSYAGKVIVLDFWATWCGPCRAEMPDLVALQDQYEADGLVIVGANVSWSGDTPQDVLSFLGSYTPTLNYPIVMSTADVEEAYNNIDAIPTTYVIDRDNLIRKQFIGTQSRSTLERQIIPLLYGKTRLAGQRSGDQMLLQWPATALSFTLESSTDPAQAAWSPWPWAPSVINGTNTVLAPLSGGPGFFRLRLPY
jgi:thiol-disulfide isomerase/thioredoxin